MSETKGLLLNVPDKARNNIRHIERTNIIIATCSPAETSTSTLSAFSQTPDSPKTTPRSRVSNHHAEILPVGAAWNRCFSNPGRYAHHEPSRPTGYSIGPPGTTYVQSPPCPVVSLVQRAASRKTIGMDGRDRTDSTSPAKSTQLRLLRRKNESAAGKQKNRSYCSLL